MAAFKAELEQRFGDGGAERRGVHLLTYHAAKGLEFELVFLPRLEERELPAKQAKTDEQIAEERRLLYVGITRAKRELVVTWVKKPSRFLEELGRRCRDGRRRRRASTRSRRGGSPARAQDDVPAYLVFHNSTLEEIAARKPRSLDELAAVPGVGPAKLERYGEGVLAALAEA